MKLIELNPFGLESNPWNSNKVDRDNFEKLKKSVSSLEMFKPIIVREHKGKYQILGGYHRNEAAKELGYKLVPVLNLGPLPDQKAKEVSLIDNTRYGIDDSEKLEQLINSMETDLIGEIMPDIEELELPVMAEELTDFEEKVSERATDTPETSKTLKFRYDDLDQADEIEDKLLIIAKDNNFYYADGYANLNEALYHVLIREPLNDKLANGEY